MHMNAQLPKTRMRRISGYASIWNEANGLYCLVASQQPTCLPTVDLTHWLLFRYMEGHFQSLRVPFPFPLSCQVHRPRADEGRWD